MHKNRLYSSTTALLAAALLLAAAPVARADGPATASSFEWVERPELPRVAERAEHGEVRFNDRIVRFPINVWGGWDLAKASGQGTHLPPEMVEFYYHMFIPDIADQARAHGFFAPAVAVPDDASIQDKLLGYMGRQP